MAVFSSAVCPSFLSVRLCASS